MDNLTSQNDRFLRRVHQDIDENLSNENYSVEDLAKNTGLSRSMLHRKLKQLTGKSAGDLIIEKRLEKACQLLSKQVGTVSEIAYQVGFNSPSYFNRVFKKKCQLSPGDLIKHPEKYTQASSGKKKNRPGIPGKVKKYAWIALVAGNILLVYLIVNVWNSVPFEEKDWIIITDFENMTGDSIFNRSLNTALEISLQQSSFVNVYPRRRINEVLQRMEADRSTPVNENIGLEIAKREGVKLIVVCAISKIGRTYTLSSKIIEVKSGENLRSQSFQAKGKDEVLHVLDKLGRKLRKDLGESLRSNSYENLPLPAATTSSLEALDFLVKAHQAFSVDGNTGEAINLYLEAIRLDENFALAHADLGSIYYWINDRTNGDKHFSKALSQLERLTDKEKLYIEARIERSKGNHDAAVTKFKAFLRKYPDSQSAWFGLGYSYMMLKHYVNAIEAFKKSLEVFDFEDPNTYVNIASCYNLMPNYSEAIKYYLKAFEINPGLLTQGNLNHEFGFTYVKMGDYSSARETFDKMANGDDDNMKAQGLRSHALLNMYLGNFKDAIEMLNESSLLYKALGYNLSIYRNTLYLVSAYKQMGMKKEYIDELKTAKSLLDNNTFSPSWLLYYGKMIVRENRIEESEQILEILSSRLIKGNRKDESAFQILSGEIELAKGNSDKAEELLKTGVKIHTSTYNLESLANFYYKTGKSELAIPEYNEIINLKSLGWEAQIYHNEAYSRLGKIYEMKKDTLRAIKYYEDLMEIWKEADENVPELKQVSYSLKKLKGKPS